MELSIFNGKYLIAKDGIKHLFGNRYIITACKINYHDFNATKHGVKYILFESSEDFSHYLFIIAQIIDEKKRHNVEYF